MTDRVETPKQLAERVGVSEHQIRNLIRTGELESVPIGGRIYIPADAWALFIERKRVCKCHDEIKEPSLDTSKIAEPSMSPGPSTVAAASARLARQAAKMLKASSQNGSANTASEVTAQVIPLKRL
jgi:excisionase family DNA binding protein